ncbi:hypothetical protein HOK51_00040 [Candidatus Woesearchaeota archaeon]|jgi:hypothetical protein|nr:hypothetical protein [Candidatus Woesearchaeota archaeon]MBT6518201.1 hypothetical protein [Candidatus Woesearchaeota archaeon]MBT7368530.1 hypothetical protein [Candidatus Woesearchaeota archaeon]
MKPTEKQIKELVHDVQTVLSVAGIDKLVCDPVLENFRVKYEFVLEIINFKKEKKFNKKCLKSYQDKLIATVRLSEANKLMGREHFELDVNSSDLDVNEYCPDQLDSIIEYVLDYPIDSVENILISLFEYDLNRKLDLDFEIQKIEDSYENKEREVEKKYESNSLVGRFFSTFNEKLEEIKKPEELTRLNYRFKEFITYDEVSKVVRTLDAYNLPKKVPIVANIGYDPRASSEERLVGLSDFKKNNGRSIEQRLVDKVWKKIDSNVIDMLSNISRYDPDDKVVELATDMILLYEMQGGFNV